MKRHHLISLLVFLLLVYSVSFIQQASAQSIKEYRKEIVKWHRERISELKKENGWLNLAGLFWLEEGIHSFGSGKANAVVFPEGSLPAIAGSLERRKDTVLLFCSPDVPLLLNGRPFQRAVVYMGANSDPAVMRYGNWMWSIIQREERIGIRLRDLDHPQLKRFSGIERFPVVLDWRIEATLISNNRLPSISITNVLGQTSRQKSPGTLKFAVNGKEYSLDALQEGDQLFILFSDATNGESTYPSGRFLYADLPDAFGKTVLDFNKAINPPCAFTLFATCPLPPSQNRLPFAVTAGEKEYHPH